ncbi:MAG: hypothetical protein ABGX04_05295 [Myxococcales bacterium]|nr:hypothetical protein [Myxococcales bacterium]HIK84377.1 hypothetical protein [Myxococcales bacterium]
MTRLLFAAELRSDITDAVERDTDVANTALVFHNSGVRDAANSEVLGHGMTSVPAKGVRYLRAPDLSDCVDFVGSALCKAKGNVTPSDVYFSRQYAVLSERSKIKRRTMERRKREYLAQKAA